MQKLFLRLLPAFAIFGATMVSCSDDDDATVNYEPPVHKVAIDDLQRTQATFSVEAPEAADFAYIIVDKNEAPVTDAEEIFKNGTVAMLKDGKGTATTFDIEGAKDYVVYTAVRRINPYVYSEVIATDLSTNLPYTDIVTLDKVGLTQVAYHIEMPEGAAKVKHIVVKEADYKAIKNIIGSLGEFNEMLYLKVFGFTSENSDDFDFDQIVKYDYDAHSLLHTDTPYYLMAGVVDDSGEIDPDQFQLIKFNTRKPDEAPYNIQVAIETTSTQALVSVTPDPEIVEYRMLVEAREEFDFALNEGEAQMWNLIVGQWDDEQNTPKRLYTGAVQNKSIGFIPNSEYVVGIVGYDAQRREKRIRIDFVTGDPTGPKPTVTITDEEPSVVAPWNTKAFNVKVTNTTEVRYGFFIKSQIDQLLNSGSTLTNIVNVNGTACSATMLQQMLSNDGLVFETSDLQPQTEYMFAVYARNDEYVTAVASSVFRTEEAPLVGGNVRKNMPGEYIASTTDEDGNTVTFPVTIAAGYDTYTTGLYKEQNRLVAFGFGPQSQFPFVSPTDLINSGMSSDDANAKYGPKWFIEFASETDITVPLPTGTNKWVMSYDSASGSDLKMTGMGVRSNGRKMFADKAFPVEVSADGNTITIKGVYLSSQKFYYNPTMVIPSSDPWGFSDPTIFFACYSDLVLTKKETPASARLLKTKLSSPRIVVTQLGQASIKNGRNEIVNKLK